MANLVEEDIIKKRLLIEGDSGNEDRLINKLIKSFVKWATHSPDNNSEQLDETTEYLFEQMMISLSHAEFGLLRNHFIFEMNLNEQENYKVLYEKINYEIEKAEKKIISNKIDLQEARKIRKNRQEYDVLAKQIKSYPDRKEMQATIIGLEEKLENLKKSDLDYNKKLEVRHKQFSVVLQSLSSLKNLIESDLKPCDLMMTDNRVNKDAVAVDMNNEDDMDEDLPVANTRDRRAKHYVNEVEMEEAS